MQTFGNSPHTAPPPLILQSARQTGKTWIMQEFGKIEHKNTAYLNCTAQSIEGKPSR